VPAAVSTANVLLVDDHDLMRRLLRRAIEVQPGLKIVGEAADGTRALEQARELEPDLVVLDLAMPELDGFEVAKALRKELPGCLILVFSAFEASRAEESALAAGADRYLEKAKGFQAAAEAAAELAVSGRP